MTKAVGHYGAEAKVVWALGTPHYLVKFMQLMKLSDCQE
jgi:hypothetical protein